MLYKLVFGDSSCDGHSISEEVYVYCPNKKFFEEAKESIKNQYGYNFFKGFAYGYQDPHLSKAVCEALYEADYPLERLHRLADEECPEEINSMLDVADSGYELCIYQIMDMYLHLLNYHGAHLTEIGCPFEELDVDHVGYGCFE
jgi:signal transduction protein with GAF and PtsI domain